MAEMQGIEINLLNGQKALIYPKYAEKPLLQREEVILWDVRKETEIEALKVEDVDENTVALAKLGSRAVEWALQFFTKKKIHFKLPSLLAALEIQHQKKEIDALAEIIEGADLLRDFTPYTWSCSRYAATLCWCAIGSNGYTSICSFDESRLVVPTILYR